MKWIASRQFEINGAINEKIICDYSKRARCYRLSFGVRLVTAGLFGCVSKPFVVKWKKKRILEFGQTRKGDGFVLPF